MSIVVRMKVILSPPGLILKEKAPGGKRVHADGGLPSDRHPGFDAPKVSYPSTAVDHIVTGIAGDHVIAVQGADDIASGSMPFVPVMLLVVG